MSKESYPPRSEKRLSPTQKTSIKSTFFCFSKPSSRANHLATYGESDNIMHRNISESSIDHALITRGIEAAIKITEFLDRKFHKMQ